jgi:hypothetical protein
VLIGNLSRAALLTLIAHQDLVAKVLPDLLVNLDEARLKTNLGHVAWSWKVDRIVALDCAGAGGDHEHAVAERDGFLEVVRHEDHGRGAGRPEVEELVLHQRAGLHVERAEGLVHQEDARAVDEALRQGDAFAHATRKLIRVSVLESRQSDALDPVPRSLARVAGRSTVVAGTGGHVLEHRLPREDRVGLEDVADTVRDAVDRFAEHVDLAVARRLETRDERKRGRLSATGRPDHRAELTRLHSHVQVTQRRVHGARRRQKTFRRTAELDRRSHCRSGCGACHDRSSHAVVVAFLVVLVRERPEDFVLGSQRAAL